jgi:hypothetical protein
LTGVHGFDNFFPHASSWPFDSWTSMMTLKSNRDGMGLADAHGFFKTLFSASYGYHWYTDWTDDSDFIKIWINISLMIDQCSFFRPFIGTTQISHHLTLLSG